MTPSTQLWIVQDSFRGQKSRLGFSTIMRLIQADREAARMADNASEVRLKEEPAPAPTNIGPLQVSARASRRPLLLQPTIFHVTHWKAGSQWLHKILMACLPDRIVSPLVDDGRVNAQFLHRPLVQGGIYPTVYITREEFDSVPLPLWWRRFVIIRDLRDTLVSGYFSLKHSHSLAAATNLGPAVHDQRARLNLLTTGDGLIYLMARWLKLSANVQQSWLQAGEPLIRYEDLLASDVEILSRVLLGRCKLPVSAQQFKAAVRAMRFERLTGGRQRGKEDILAHERKGVAGDWRHYFTPRVKDVFKEHYGQLLVDTGYEHDSNW
jgi:Sulfotransferase domain